MPNIVDSTVVASAYDTGGNGGRKVVRLSNGWLVSVLTETTFIRFYRSSDNGFTWTPIGWFSVGTGVASASIVSHGTIVYFIGTGIPSGTGVYFNSFDATTQTNVGLSGTVLVDTSQTGVGITSLAMNEAKTELHATWPSKNATYPNSFNIRYAKGSINASTGAVTWGAVEQLTKYNSSAQNINNPSIIVKGNEPIIISQWYINSGVNSYIFTLKETGLATLPDTISNWSRQSVFTADAFLQTNPSAIFVPKSVNGLANGRIWVAWNGFDSTDTGVYNLRFSYSDDGGVSWATMQKLTSGNVSSQILPSITANKKNEIFITWIGRVGSYNQIRKIKNTNGVWGSAQDMTSSSQNNESPSTLYDPTFDFVEPLFIYKTPTKVGFYGSWTNLNNSVPQGSIGIKTSKDNLLPYTITTEGTVSTITEKVNGVTVGTKTATSGQALTVGLTQGQWDAVRYGKYKNAGYEYENILSNSVSDWEQGSYVNVTVGNSVTLYADTFNLILKTPVTILGGVTYKLKFASGYRMSLFEAKNDGIITANYTSSWLPNDFIFTTNTASTRIYFLFIANPAVNNISPEVIPNAVPELLMITPPEVNTLTISMESETWTYTFDKRLPTGADMEQVTKALQDTQGVFLPAVKSKLAVRFGTGLSSESTWDDFIDKIESGLYGSALAEHVLASKTIATESGIVQGTMINRGAVNMTATIVDQPILEGYHDGTGKLIKVTFDPSKVLLGTSIAGTAGTLVENKKASGTFTTDANGWFSISGLGFLPSVIVAEWTPSNNNIVARKTYVSGWNGVNNYTAYSSSGVGSGSGTQWTVSNGSFTTYVGTSTTANNVSGNWKAYQ